MYWLDTILLVLLGLGALLGALRGLLWQVAGVVSCALGLGCAVSFHEDLTPLCHDLLFQGAPEPLPGLFTWLLLFASVCLFCFLTARWLDRLIKKVKLQWLNRLLGATLGGLKAATLVGGSLLAVEQHLDERTQEVLGRSVLAQGLGNGVRSALTLLPRDWSPLGDRFLPLPGRTGPRSTWLPVPPRLAPYNFSR